MQLTAAGASYEFSLRTGKGQGLRVSGNITLSGEITVAKQETSFNTCPICLSRGTLIDTPAGPVPVEQVRRGTVVWTVDSSGERASGVVAETIVTPVPRYFRVVKLELSDGRSVTASPGHPTAERRALGEYAVGDSLDGALVAAVAYLEYGDGATYDILPAGATGVYWANGIRLKSTLLAP